MTKSGAFSRYGSTVERRGVERFVHPDRGLLVVAQSAELRGDFLFERHGFRSGLDDALRFAALQVQKEPREPEGVGTSRRPVHVAQPLRSAVGAGLEREIPLPQQPRLRFTPRRNELKP